MTDNRTTELLPCPFCGGDAFVRIDVSLRPTQSRYRIGCDKDSTCHGWYGHSRYYATEAEAIAAWNTRSKHVVGEPVVNIHPMKKAPSINVLLAQFGYHYAATTSMIEMAALVDSYADRIREALCDD